MGDSLSPATRALLDAAKSDAPRAAARAQVWGAVSTATGVAAGVVKGGTALGVAAATASSGKLLVVGALLGSLLTAGVGYGVARLVTGRHGDVVEAPEEGRLSTASPDPVLPIPIHLDPQNALGGDGPSSSQAGPASATRSPSSPNSTACAVRVIRTGTEDPLGRVATLIEEANRALRRGDPEGALVSLDAARRLGWHGLEPEALAVRVGALRSLGRDAEADSFEATLRAKYPEHSLSR
jgi:hypothetical protein